MTDDHIHDRFLFEKDGFFIFGCINPFCGHGSPALPNYFKIPHETKQVIIKLLSHSNRKVSFEITFKDTDKKDNLTCNDNLKDCADAFARIMIEQKE